MKSYKFLLPLVTMFLASCNANPIISELSTEPEDSSDNSSEEIINPNEVDVIILAGQSNAEGHTHISELKKNVDEDKFAIYSSGLFNTQIKFNCDSGRNKSNSFTSVKLGQGFNSTRFGPEIGMAEVFDEAELKRDVYIIKHAIGGTNLYNQWRSPSLGNGDLYNDFIIDVYNSLALLEDEGLEPIVRGICWMQGEADATNPTYTNSYKEYEKVFFEDIANDLETYLNGDLHIYDALISDCTTWTFYQLVNKAKLENASENENHHIIDTLGAKLSYFKEPVGAVDYFHYDSLDMIKLGNMFAKAILENSL